MTKLAPNCSKIEIAGDIRLARETVKEIIIVCIPHEEYKPYQLSLLPGEPPKKEKVRAAKFIEALKRNCAFTGTGLENRIRTRAGKLPATIYTATEENFGYQLMLHSGPILFTKLVLECLDNERYNIYQNHLYRGGKLVRCTSEEALFKFAGLRNWPLPHRVHYHDFPPKSGLAKAAVFAHLYLDIEKALRNV